jgi:hypothetical protein
LVSGKDYFFICLWCFGKEVRKGKAKSPNMFRMRFVLGRKSLRVEEEAGFCMWVCFILLIFCCLGSRAYAKM